MADDAVLAYHTALELHGKAYSVHEEFVFLPHRAVRKAQISGGEFRGVSFQKALLHGRNEMYGVSKTERLGIEIQVTTRERTIVDLLDRPELGGGWEEIWRSLESVEYFDLEPLVRYTLLLKNGTTTAKVGFFLDQHRKALMVEDKHLRSLKRRLPEQLCYMERSKRVSGKLVAAAGGRGTRRGLPARGVDGCTSTRQSRGCCVHVIRWTARLRRRRRAAVRCNARGAVPSWKEALSDAITRETP